MPTAIAVVPSPGPGPKAPKMFVTELRGGVKTVANDWTVAAFTKVETFKPEVEWPDAAGEGGMAGICLAPEQGYVFVTYTHRDKYGVLRNGLSRFTTTPRTFEGPAADRRDYLELFEKEPSAFSHQIGAWSTLRTRRVNRVPVARPSPGGPIMCAVRCPSRGSVPR